MLGPNRGRVVGVCGKVAKVGDGAEAGIGEANDSTDAVREVRKTIGSEAKAPQFNRG